VGVDPDADTDSDPEVRRPNDGLWRTVLAAGGQSSAKTSASVAA